jgi:hypothetical protein
MKRPGRTASTDVVPTRRSHLEDSVDGIHFDRRTIQSTSTRRREDEVASRRNTPERHGSESGSAMVAQLCPHMIQLGVEPPVRPLWAQVLPMVQGSLLCRLLTTTSVAPASVYTSRVRSPQPVDFSAAPALTASPGQPAAGRPGPTLPSRYERQRMLKVWMSSARVKAGRPAGPSI